MRKSENMNIHEAIEWMREGRRVQRVGWNGKGMWIKLVGDETYPAGNLCGHNMSEPITVKAHICLFTADGEWQPGWLCSQADLLASDWLVLWPTAPVPE